MGISAIGIDLGGTAVKIGLVDRFDGLVEQVQLDTEADEGPEHVINRLAEGVRLMQSHAFAPVSGIGVGAPGSVDWERTTMRYPPNFPAWGVVNVAEGLRKRVDIDGPIIVENDANVAGLGSAFFGAGQPFDSFLMVTLGTGVGGAIIHNKKLFRGTTGAAGEFGHLSIDYAGPPNRSGTTGSIEAYLGQRFLSRYARYRLLRNPDTLLHQTAGEDMEDLTPKLLFEAAQAGDVAAQEILAWAGHKLGRGMGSLVNVLDIRKVVVGGGVSAAGDFILEPARKALLDGVMPGLRDGVELVQETLGNQVGMLGAASLAFAYLDEQDSTRTPAP